MMGCAFFGPQSLKKIETPSFVVMVFIDCPSELCPDSSHKSSVQTVAASYLHERLPGPQSLGHQLRTTPVVPPVQDAQILGIGTHVDTTGPGPKFRLRVRPRREVAGRAIGRLQPDLARPL